MREFIFSITCIVLLGACATRKDMVYLQPSETQLQTQYENFVPRIQQEDLLTITVSSADLKATIPFNQQNPYQLNAATTTDIAFKPTYLVDAHGEIDFPILGKVKVAGLTRMEATEHLRNLLKKYIVDAGVNLSFANFKVTVLGEVNKPGTYTMPQERITILEALGMAGDMTIKGVRNNVLLIREKDGKKEMQRLNLLSDSVLISPYYYLAQNDVIYVEPNGSQIRNSSLGQNTNILISVSSLIITIVAIVVSNSN